MNGKYIDACSPDLISYSLNVSMTNFLDTMIDYPNAKQYASGLFKKLHELELLTEQEVKNYEAHVANLEKFDDY